MGDLATLMDRSARKGPYFAKDRAKAARATKFVGQGSAASSTRAYALAVAPLANVGAYEASDVVFVSSEGAHGGRFDPAPGGTPAGAYRDLDLAIAAGASFVVDAPADRARSCNVGEQQVAAHLEAAGWRETSPGFFANPGSSGRPR